MRGLPSEYLRRRADLDSGWNNFWKSGLVLGFDADQGDKKGNERMN